MSKSESKIPSPARSQGSVTPRRARTRRTLSTASARSAASVRLSSVLDKFYKDDFMLSPLKRRSVLPDDTEIIAPSRASWWKRLEGSSRDVLEALDTNKMTDGMLVEEYEFEVEKDKQNHSVPESSDNESIASIVVPQRRLFNQKKQPQGKFADIGSRKSLGRTNIEDQSIEVAPKTLFNKGPRNKPVFPAALLNSTNKTINKTVEPEPTKQTRPKLFGQAGTKRKNMFADFVLSDSEEEDSEVQHKVFGFKKSKRISLDTRNRRMPSLTPSMTTEIDIDDWNLLPSSTMIGAQEVSRMSTGDVEQVQEENQDVALTEENASLIREANNRSNKKSAIENYENYKTLTKEDLRDASNQDIKINESIKTTKTHEQSKAKLNESVKNKTLQNKSSTRANAENEEVIEEVLVEEQQNNGGTKSMISEMDEQSIEDKMAELHRESLEKQKSRENIQLERTKENLENYKDTKTENHTNGKNEYEIEPSSEEQKVQDASKAARNANQSEDDDLPQKDKSEEELEQVLEAQNYSKDASVRHQDDDLNDISKNRSEEEIDPNVEDQASEGHSKQASNTNQEEDIEDQSEEEIEPSAGEPDTREEASETNQDEDMNVMSEKDKSEEVEHSANDEENQHESNEVSHDNEDEENQHESNEVSHDNEDEENQHESNEVSHDNEDEENQHESNEVSHDNEDEENQHESNELSHDNEDVENQHESNEVSHDNEDEKNQHESNEVSHDNEDDEMEDISEKDKSEEIEHHQNIQHDSEDKIDENQDEEMEKMVWNDNDDEKTSDSSKAGMDMEGKQNYEVVPNEIGSKSGQNDRTVDRKDIFNKSKNLTNKSHKIVVSTVENDQMDQEEVDETPNNSTHDTTGRNRKKGTKDKSPEAVLQNITIDNESFRPIGRSTTFRKSKSMYEMMNRPSLAPVEESTIGSEGSRNSSTEGSGWDSHRTTRKTIRQTLGKEYTTRKSLRALVMEQSAKRQTELYNKNTSNINKTKNKTALEGNDRNASKINKSKNKTESKDKNASTIHLTKNGTVLEDVNNKNAAINKTKNKTLLEEVNDQQIRSSTTNHRLSSNQSRILSFPVHGTSNHHVPDPVIPEHHISHKSVHEMKDPEILDQMSNRGDSINMLDNNDSGPEISMNVSYGQGMSADTANEASDVEMNNYSKQFKEVPRNASIRNSDQEILDYEASELEKSEQEISESEVEQENLEQDDSMQQSVQDGEKKNSEPQESENEVETQSDHVETEQENEDSQHEIEAESEQDESQQEIAESENEESQQEIESEQEESQQELAESENEEPQQEIESEDEESQQEIESERETQQEIESEQEESQQEIEPESDQESENEQDNNVSQPDTDHESDQETREPERDSENDDFVSRLNSRCHDRRSGASRVVFDSQMMSVDEIDFEGVSRQTDYGNEGAQSDNDNTEQFVREPELSRNTRISEPSVHEVSVGTKKSMLLMQMQKIAQKNMELRQKISHQVEKSLKPNRNCNITSPVPKYSIRRMTKEPRQPKKKPTRTGVAMATLPRAFLEDLMHKPPKRYQPANAPWITKRLYKFLETKLEPKYDYRARVRAEELVQTIHSFTKLVRRRDAAPPRAVDELKREMARLRVVDTHYEFYEFFHEFMPREVRIKVNPDMVNKIPMPRNGIFGEILQSLTTFE